MCNYICSKTWSFLPVSIFFYFIFSITLFANAENVSYLYTLTLSSAKYPGTYEGESVDDLPNGKGKFTTENGVIFSGQFKDGLLNGTIKEIQPDNTYSVYKCSSGKPYGKRINYSAKKEIISEDWYYDQQLVSEMISLAKTPDYPELLADPNSYTQQLYKIEGTIEKIIGDWQNIYLLVRDKESHSFICTYQNNDTSRYTQAWVPNFIEGDSVILYGSFFQTSVFSLSGYRSILSGYHADQNSLSLLFSGDLKELPVDTETTLKADQIFATSFPYISLFYGTTKDEDREYHNADTKNLTYDLISKYPYFYFFDSYSSDGIIQAANIDYENSSIALLVQEKQSKKFVYATYSYDGKDYFPLVGDTISFKAQIKGNYKLISTDEKNNSYIFLSIPYLHIYKCEKNK